MTKSILGFLVGLILIVGTPLTTVSLVEVYSLEPTFEKSSTSTQTFQTFHKADFPEQEGNIRFLKTTLQKVRNSQDQQIILVERSIERFIFRLAESKKCASSKLISSCISLSTVPLYLRIRTLIV